VDCNSFGPRAIEAAVALYGADRIVCGTDGSAFGVDWTRKALTDAQIGEEAREQILHGNATAIMARVGKDDRMWRGVFAVVYTYNRKELVAQCLASIFAQTLPPERRNSSVALSSRKYFSLGSCGGISWSVTSVK